MEETLGKRISANRKKLGLTQDKLAEQLGVTAQAVSKWENDQACPDITTLPKLAGIFGVTTDILLGIEKEPVREAEIITKEKEPDGLHLHKGNWEFRWDGGRRSSIGIALWVLLVGGLLLASEMYGLNVGLWGLLWPSGLLLFGLFGLFPRFSFFRLGCALFGGYYLLSTLGIGIFAQEAIGKKYFLPILLLLFGLSLLVDSFKKDRKPKFEIVQKGRSDKTRFNWADDVDRFRCDLSFGEANRPVNMPLLRSGEASVSFGSLTVDLQGVEAVAENCVIDASCSFGELVIRVPKRFLVKHDSDTVFASMEISGQPDPEPEGVISLDGSASFGEIRVEYV